MKLFSAAVSLFATQVYANIAVPYDCYSQNAGLYGDQTGTVVSDLVNLPGLQAHDSKLASIHSCSDNETQMITGLFTIWGEWTGTEWTNLQKMPTIGRMSGLAYFDDNAALSDAGLDTLEDGTDTVFQRYWFQEASPDGEQYMAVRKFLGEMDKEDWLAPRQKMFNDADFDKDGVLKYDEAVRFLEKVRPLDKEVVPGNTQDIQLERINNHWFLASLVSSGGESMSFDDYTTVEKMMEAVYEADKLTVTGFINYWDKTSFDDEQGEKPGNHLTQVCSTVSFDGEDRITNVEIQASAEGVTNVKISTKKNTLIQGGHEKKDSDRKASYLSEAYMRFADGNDFAGLWGTVGDDGLLNSIGFVERDSVCTQGFLDTLGKEAYDWYTPTENSFATPETYTAEYRTRVDKLNEKLALYTPPVIPKKKEDEPKETTTRPADPQRFIKTTIEEETEGGSLIAAIFIWITIILVIVMIIYVQCKIQKNKNSQLRHMTD